MFQLPLGLARAPSPKAPLPAYETGYYYGLENVFTETQVEEKLSELRSHPAAPLIVPADYGCIPGPHRKQLLGILSGLYVPPARHPLLITERLCRYLHDGYRRQDGPDGSVYLVPVASGSR